HRGWKCLRILMRQMLKSKMHRAMVTRADIESEGGIEVPGDLMAEEGLSEGERVLVAAVNSGNRLETYVREGPGGRGEILIKGGAVHLIQKGEWVTILAWALSDKPVVAKRIVMDEGTRLWGVWAENSGPSNFF
ncbi:MAG: aspartate 1-decarboxylase, partial [Verrucomicrobiota bacterium]